MRAVVYAALAGLLVAAPVAAAKPDFAAMQIQPYLFFDGRLGCP